MEKRCGQCGKNFLISDEQPGTRPRYCSGACRQRAYRARKNAERKTAEVDKLIESARADGMPVTTLAEKLDAMQTQFDKRLAALKASHEQEKQSEIEKIRSQAGEKEKLFTVFAREHEDCLPKINALMVQVAQKDQQIRALRKQIEQQQQQLTQAQSPAVLEPAPAVPENLNRTQRRKWLKRLQNQG